MHNGVGVSPAQYTGAGFGKLLLFGEHAAVYGYPAVGLALPLRTTMSLSLVQKAFRTEPSLSSPKSALNVPHLPESDRDIIHALWEDLFRMAAEGRSTASPDRAVLSHLRAQQFTLQVWSNVPRSRGLGSSAAACAALAGAWKALYAESEAYGTEDAVVYDTQDAVWLLAHQLEQRFHGTPSGIDTGLAVYGGCRSFHFHGSVLPETQALPAPDFPIVAAAVPRHSDTKALVADIRRRHEAGDRKVHTTLSRLGSIAEQAIDALVAGAPAETLAAAANEADSLLVGLELDSEQLRYGLRLAREYGALGGKMSGAGGGGAFVALFSPEQAEAAAEFAAVLPARLREQGGEAEAIVIPPPQALLNRR